MTRQPVSLLYSRDPDWLQRIPGFLAGMSQIVMVADENALHGLLEQYRQTVLFLDLYGTDAVRLVRELREGHPDLMVVVLGERRSEPGLQAMAAGIFDILDATADRLRVQYLFRQARTQLELQAELRIVREQLTRPSMIESKPSRATMLLALQHLSGAMRRFEHLDLMLENMIDGVCQATRIARVGIVLSASGNAYRYHAGRNVSASLRAESWAPADTWVRWLQVHAHGVSRGTLRHIESVKERLLLEEGLALHGADLILPLFGRNRLLGWLFLGRTASGTPFQDEDVEDLSCLAEQVSIAIENALLHDSLAVQKALAENLLQTIPSGIIATSPEGRVNWLNRAAERMLHLPQGGGGDRARLPAVVTDMLHRCMGDETGVGPLEWQEPVSGCALSVQARRLDQDGSCIGAMMILQDLTGEYLLREKQNNIERAAFWNELTTALSHEVRNPLVAISTFAQLLPERYDDEEFRTSFRELTTQEVGRLNAIVDQLDLFANPPVLRFGSIEAPALLHAALFKEQHASAAAVEIKMEVEDALPPVRADMDVLSHAISHVLENAREAVAQRSDPTVVIAAGRGVMGDNHPAVVVEVRDNGKGIPAALQDKVYSPFCTTKTRGVGLGLAIVRRTMIDHEGLVEIESTEAGTTVRLLLPVATDPAEGP